MLVLNIFWISSVRGAVSKALLMSIVARSVLYGGLGTFRPSRMFVLALLGVLCLSVGL